MSLTGARTVQARQDDPRERRVVLVADPRSARRQQLARPAGPHAGAAHVLEAASLCEAFPLAEQAVPSVMALSADFAAEPELEGLVRLADMLGSRMFLYSTDARLPARAACCSHLPCIQMQPGDGIAELLARLADPRAHLSPSARDLQLPR